MTFGNQRLISVCAVVVSLMACKGGRGPEVGLNNNASRLAIFNLTPDDLLQTCGTPTRDVTGRLVSDDGIRDIRYLGSSGRAIDFRFVRDTSPESGWSGMGAWTNEAEPDGLGELLDDVDAVQDLPCVGATRAAGAASELVRAILDRRSSSPTVLPIAFLLAWQAPGDPARLQVPRID